MGVSVEVGIGEFVDVGEFGHWGVPRADVCEGVCVPDDSVVRFLEGEDMLASCVETGQHVGEIVGFAA